MFKRSLRYSFKSGLPAKRLSSKFFNIQYQENAEGFACAVVVGKSVDKKATSRHLLKRRFLEAVRDVTKGEKVSLSLVFFLKKEIKDLTFSQQKEQINEILAKAKLLLI